MPFLSITWIEYLNNFFSFCVPPFGAEKKLFLSEKDNRRLSELMGNKWGCVNGCSILTTAAETIFTLFKLNGFLSGLATWHWLIFFSSVKSFFSLRKIFRILRRTFNRLEGDQNKSRISPIFINWCRQKTKKKSPIRRRRKDWVWSTTKHHH